MKKIFTIFVFVLLSVFSFGFAGMAPEPHLMLNLPDDPDKPVMISIEEIKSVSELEGRSVILEGVFTGWEDINEPPPFSRHDWILRNETGAIFIHGPYPEGCDPMDPKTIGKEIRISGKIGSRLVTDFGRVLRVIYIDYIP